MGGYDALRPAERERLERFAAAFEDLNPADYDLFLSSLGTEDELEGARSAAMAALGGERRREAARQAAASFTATADRAISRSQPLPAISLAPRPGGSSGDRGRLFMALGRAVVAVIVWDDLAPEEREILLGPWGRLAGRALSGGG
jgi:hypothetical protein